MPTKSETKPHIGSLFERGIRGWLAWQSRRRLPRTQGNLEIAGLKAPVEVLRDEWGVAHIYAHGSEDLFLAQGFVHAQERLWQMDFQRRAASGRLSEVLGEAAAPVDRWVRTLGLRRTAEREAANLTDESRACMEAYARGVNAFIAAGPLPVEFSLLRYSPEAWSPADSLAWAKMIAWSLAVNWESELLRARLIERLGLVLESYLEPPDPSDWPTVLGEDGAAPSFLASAVEKLVGLVNERLALQAWQKAGAARPFTAPGSDGGLGSNAWVVSGQRSASGKPIFANDMHLSLSAPAIWFENHLCADEINATGVSFPGVPGLVAGHNGKIAWGFTNGFADIQDVYVERVRRGGDGQVQYLFCGEWRNAEVLHEEVRVRGGRTESVEVVITHHGPLITDLAPDLADGQALALRWTDLEPGEPVHSVLAILRARDCHEFRQAVSDWSGPVQNAVCADIKGNIAYQLIGRVPLRNRGDGSVPVPGWSGEYEWRGLVPFEELPSLFNPSRGYIVTANNRITGRELRDALGRDYCNASRAQRIVELLQGQPRVDTAYMRRMQLDQVSPAAREIAAALVRLADGDPQTKELVSLLKGWDGNLNPDSPQAAVYEVFLRAFIRRSLNGRLGEWTERYMGIGPTPGLAGGSLFSEKGISWALAALEEPDGRWQELTGEPVREVARAALAEAGEFLSRELGPDPRGWAWGRLHRLIFAHYLDEMPALKAIFDRGPYPMGGDSSTIWAGSLLLATRDWRALVGPPFRFIADLADLDHCLGVLAPGNSGHTASRHYDDQIEDWFNGEYHPMLYRREEVEAAAVERMVLRPAGA